MTADIFKKWFLNKLLSNIPANNSSGEQHELFVIPFGSSGKNTEQFFK